MSILYMDSKTFFKDFIKDQKDNTILEASYIIASERIRFGVKYKDQIMKLFYPSSSCLVVLNDEKDIKSKSNSEYVHKYKRQLSSLNIQIAIMIKGCIEEDMNVIILTSPKEERFLNHLELLKEHIENEFNFTITRYKSGININFPQCGDKKSILKTCNRVIRETKKKKKHKQMETKSGQQQYFSEMGKKKLKKLLKKNGLYLSGMNESEMIDVAVTFLI